MKKNNISLDIEWGKHPLYQHIKNNIDINKSMANSNNKIKCHKSKNDTNTSFFHEKFIPKAQNPIEKLFTQNI